MASASVESVYKIGISFFIAPSTNNAAKAFFSLIPVLNFKPVSFNMPLKPMIILEG